MCVCVYVYVCGSLSVSQGLEFFWWTREGVWGLTGHSYPPLIFPMLDSPAYEVGNPIELRQLIPGMFSEGYTKFCHHEVNKVDVLAFSWNYSLYVCVSVCLFACISLCLFACISPCLFASVSVCLWMLACICCILYLFAFVCLCVCVCLHVTVSVCLCSYWW